MNSSLWWNGPQWLPHSNKWDPEHVYNLHPDLRNLKPEEWSTSVKMTTIKVNTMVGQVSASIPENDKDKVTSKLWQYSNYKQLIHFFIGLNFIVKFIKNRSRPGKRLVTANDFAEGERLAIRTMQRQAYPYELQQLEKGERPKGDKGQFSQLKLYLDSHGIIRLHGRLNEENDLCTALMPPCTPLALYTPWPNTAFYLCSGKHVRV